MARLGPFEPRPALTVAVSGGADSMALALLAGNWVRQRQGTLRALIVDHGLRPESAEEAEITMGRLRRLEVSATRLTLTTLRPGTALAERARIMRYEALSAACRSAGSLHLLVGHHAADQSETMMMRALGNSLTHGLAAMPALAEITGVRLLRPLLTFDPAALRRLLLDRGIQWAEDPSNHDHKALRPRLRHSSGRRSDGGVARLIEAARTVGALRAREETSTAAELANRTVLRPEGFALLSPGRISVAALAALIRTIAGSPYAPGLQQIADLAARPRPATIAGVRLLTAGRTGDGLLLVREEAAMAESVEAGRDAVWDGRFRLVTDCSLPPGAFIGKLGPDAARFRRRSCLPSAVLRTLPAIRFDKTLMAVPHLGYVIDNTWAQMMILFIPRKPSAGACFLPMGS
jgi:tRNA(Ile)-lysidine synthase